MIRALLLCLLFQALAQAETLTRAYFIGKDQLWQWNVAEHDLLNPQNKRDPFSGSGPSTLPIDFTPPQPLEKPPFQSPLFRQGDTLYDFKTYKEQLKNVQGKLDHAIYNETTGRIIVSGDAPSHWLFQSRSIRISEEGSFNLVELNFEFHEEDTLIFATSATSLPGQKTLGKVGKGANTLSVEWEPQIYSENHFIDLQLTLDGKIRNQTLKLKTGFNLLNDKRQTLTLGKTHKTQKLLTLSITPHILLQGMVHISDLILDEQGKPLKRKEEINLHHELFQKGLPDPETGKTLRAFRVPPAFQTFLTMTSNAGDSDPFGAEEPQKSLQKEEYLTDPDPRIPAWPTDRLLETRIVSESTQPQIIQSTQQDGRWHTLVLTSTIERLEDN